ncbi:MAG: NifU family protein [Minisyncoccia bacterium]|jgi:Fe-S cluster biogenesis protein NfuA
MARTPVKKASIEKKVRDVIDKVRPYIEMHGGGVDLVGVEGGTVKLRISGACVGCSLADLTYNTLITGLLRKEVPGVREVVLVK